MFEDEDEDNAEDVLLQVTGEDEAEDPHLDPEVHVGLRELMKLCESFDFFSRLVCLCGVRRSHREW